MKTANSLIRTTACRKGAVAPLVAFMMPVFLAMAAFMVDTGYIVVTITELQNAADVAALAGASQLEKPTINLTSARRDSVAAVCVLKARAEAKKYGLLNSSGGVNLQLADADIVVGYQATSSSTVVPWSNGQPFPNIVQVRVRRDSTTNDPLGLFFGPIIGSPTWSGSATAKAGFNATGKVVTGFKTTPNGPNPLLLPIAIDQEFVNSFLSTGRSPDGNTYDRFTAVIPSPTQLSPNNVNSGSDNIPELQGVYPNNSSPGNFGLMNLRYTNPENNTPQFSDWILNGPTPSDISTFGSNGFQATPANPAILKGGPGLKSSLVPDFASIVGQQRIMPIFSSYSGQGSNTYYTVVGFMGVQVVSATGRGSNIEIVFQPAIVVDPTATSATTTSTTPFYVYSKSPISLIE